MSKTILVCGYGTGISAAVAKHFGSHGFSVALIARDEKKLTAAAAELNKQGIKAHAFPTDVGNTNAVTEMIAHVRKSLGSVTVIHWNAYSGLAGDVTTAPLSELQTNFNVGVTGLVAAVQAALPDLKASKQSAVLVTGGGFAYYGPETDSLISQWNAMGLSITKAAQHKLTGILTAKLSQEGIYIGEVVVTGMVKGTAFDSGNATLEASAIAAKFYELYTARTVNTVNI